MPRCRTRLRTGSLGLCARDARAGRKGGFGLLTMGCMRLVRSAGLRRGRRTADGRPGCKGRRGLLTVHGMTRIRSRTLTLLTLLSRRRRVTQVACLLSGLFTRPAGLARQQALLLPGQFLRCQHTFGREDDLGLAEVGLEARRLAGLEQIGASGRHRAMPIAPCHQPQRQRHDEGMTDQHHGAVRVHRHQQRDRQTGHQHPAQQAIPGRGGFREALGHRAHGAEDDHEVQDEADDAEVPQHGGRREQVNVHARVCQEHVTRVRHQTVDTVGRTHTRTEQRLDRVVPGLRLEPVGHGRETVHPGRVVATVTEVVLDGVTQVLVERHVGNVARGLHHEVEVAQDGPEEERGHHDAQERQRPLGHQVEVGGKQHHRHHDQHDLGFTQAQRHQQGHRQQQRPEAVEQLLAPGIEDGEQHHHLQHGHDGAGATASHRALEGTDDDVEGHETGLVIAHHARHQHHALVERERQLHQAHAQDEEQPVADLLFAERHHRHQEHHAPELEVALGTGRHLGDGTIGHQTRGHRQHDEGEARVDERGHGPLEMLAARHRVEHGRPGHEDAQQREEPGDLGHAGREVPDRAVDQEHADEDQPDGDRQRVEQQHAGDAAQHQGDEDQVAGGDHQPDQRPHAQEQPADEQRGPGVVACQARQAIQDGGDSHARCLGA